MTGAPRLLVVAELVLLQYFRPVVLRVSSDAPHPPFYPLFFFISQLLLCS